MNQTRATMVSRDLDLTIFDSLPAELRAWVRDLPYDFKASDVRIYLRQRGLKSAVNTLPAKVRIILSQQTLATWGPDHPAIAYLASPAASPKPGA